MVRRTAAARRHWRDIWRLLDDHEMADERYAPMVSILAVQLGLADDAAEAVFHPVDPITGSRFNRSLAEYLAGIDIDPKNETVNAMREAALYATPDEAEPLVEFLKMIRATARNSQTAQELTVLRDSLRQAVAVAKEFGMSPASLAKIGGIEKAPEESPMMAYIRAANERMKNRRAAG